jgi:hypothetical protein
MIKKNRSKLSDAEKVFLADNYLYLSDDAIADILNLASATTARKIRSNLGLSRSGKKLKEFIKEVPLVIWLQRDLYTSNNFENSINLSI